MISRTTLLSLTLVLTACPDHSDTPPSNDDTSKPADGGTGGEASCEGEQVKIKQLEAELAECRATTAPK